METGRYEYCFHCTHASYLSTRPEPFTSPLPPTVALTATISSCVELNSGRLSAPYDWRAQLRLPGIGPRVLGQFATVNDAGRAYDAEVRRRGWQGLTLVHFSAQRMRFLCDKGCIF